MVAMRFSLLASLVAVAACKPLEQGAREHFARVHSCPEDRVQVQPRPELKYSELLLGKAGGPSPPDEVKNDPERLAKWRSDHARDHTGLDELEIYAATGCDHQLLLACSHPVDGRDGAQLISEVACVEAPAPK